jgi:SAM-dependent methyltransferase
MSGIPNAAAYTDDFEFAALSEAENYRHALLRAFAVYLRGSTLEVGAGIGQVTSLLAQSPAITRLVSLEPDPRFCSRFRASFPDLRLVQGTIDDLPGGEAWDAILSINVLEHIEEDERELAAYRKKLAREKGALCLFVPARPEIYAPIDRDFGHFRRYTRPELRQKLERAGFEIRQLHYYNLAGYFAWWLSFCVLKKRGFNVRTVRWFDRIVFPLTNGLELKICPPPIGQSLLAIARVK